MALDELEIPQALHDLPVAGLSGGWQRLVMLARVAVREPDLNLMDEPTNHLELARIGHLQRWILGLPRGVGLIVASHGRAFLDDIATRTLFLRDRQSPVFARPDTGAQEALQDELTEKAAAAIHVGHDRTLIHQFGTRLWCIDQGKLVEVDSPEPLIARMLASGD